MKIGHVKSYSRLAIDMFLVFLSMFLLMCDTFEFCIALGVE